MEKNAKRKHQQIDPIFKQLLEDKFASYSATCQTEFEVGRLPRKIDAVITIEDEDEMEKIHSETPFFYFQKDNQVEFKARRDRLTEDDYHNIHGRKHFLCRRPDVSAFDMTVTIITAGKPRNVIKYARQRKRPFVRVKDKKGYYKSDAYPSVYLIVANELPIIPKNYLILLFASSKQKFREFLEQVIIESNTTYIRYAYEVRAQLTREVLTMAGISATLSREDLEFIAGDIGRDLVAVMNTEEVLEGMDSEKQQQLAASMSPENVMGRMDSEKEQRLAAYMSPENVVRGMDTEKQRRLAASMNPENVMGGMDSEKQRRLAAYMNPEAIAEGMDPEKQQKLLEYLLKMSSDKLN